MENTTKRVDMLTKELVIQSKSLDELNNEIKALESSMAKLAVGTKDWITQNESLGKLKDQFKNLLFKLTGKRFFEYQNYKII
jgi:uncharacterized coiled-coil DUF342 family protein